MRKNESFVSPGHMPSNIRNTTRAEISKVLKLKNQEWMWLDTQALRNEVGIGARLPGKIDAWKYYKC